MNKNIILGLLGVGVVMAGIYVLTKEDTVKKEVVEVKDMEAIEDGSVRISDFLRTDLSEEEKVEVESILTEFESARASANKILDEASKSENGNMAEAFVQANQIMEDVKVKVLSFLDIQKSSEFEMF
jgi:hypothetical protein